MNFRKPVNPYDTSNKKQIPNISSTIPTDGGAFGAALDVMSFAHDIVMITDTSIAVGTAIMDSSKTKQVTVYDGIGTIAGGRKQSIEEVNNTLSKLQSGQVCPPRNYKDPLRELVLISETPTVKPDNTYVSNVTTLAKEASVLEHVKEVLPEQAGGIGRRPSLHAPAKSVVPVPVELEKSSLSTMFTDPKDAVDPAKELEFLKKLQELEESDSEGIGGEKPVLGKISIIRRAKSAVSRTTFEQKTNDKHPLFHVAWEQRESIKQRPATTGATASATVDIEPEEAGDEDYVTVAEVKSHMEMFHLRKSIPPPETKLKEERSGKYSRSRRNKTSKYNKSVKHHVLY